MEMLIEDNRRAVDHDGDGGQKLPMAGAAHALTAGDIEPGRMIGAEKMPARGIEEHTVAPVERHPGVRT